MYYNATLKWKQPKEGSDEMEKKSKSFLIYAESCTEAEGKMINWTPSNYQDPEVTDVKKTNIGELRLSGKSETFWLIKIMDDFGDIKPKPYLIVYDADYLDKAVAKATSDWSTSELETVSRFKSIVDDDLIDSAGNAVSRVFIDPADSEM